MSFVQLDRQFITWNDKEPAEAEARFSMGRLNGGLDWPKLLEHYRVVVLAEAGSGKSDELTAQADIQRAAGRHAFVTTVQEVARDGLPGCLGVEARRQFEAWKASQAQAWFFIDSVDEAKLDNIRLENALRKIADGIDGVTARAHIVLSGRHTDWEAKADLERLQKVLPVPRPVPQPPAPNEVLVRTLRSERPPPAQEPEQPLVVLMAPLDPDRVQRFAVANGIDRVGDFIAAIEEANLWSLAARPLDLAWLVDFWRQHGRVGTLAEMLDESLRQRLREPDPARYRNDEVLTTRAMEALERVGAALDFGRTDKIVIPDSQLSFQPAAPDFNLDAILPDWSAGHRLRLLSRPVFDPATFGRVRLHNDNLGEVRSYLAARWLWKRRQTNASFADIFQLLFATTYGVSVIRPSMTQTVAWLSIWDEDVAREVIARDAGLLLMNGDPASLSLATRTAALTHAIEQIVATGDRLGFFERKRLRRLATPDMAPCVRALWSTHKAHENARLLVLLVISLGRLEACADIATEAVFGGFRDRYTLIYGADAIVAVADDTLLRRLAAYVKENVRALPGQFLWISLERLVPSYVSADELVTLLGALSDEQRDANYGLQIHGPELVARLANRDDVEHLLKGFMVLMGPSAPPGTYQETEAEKACTPGVAAAARKLLELVPPSEAPDIAIDAALRLGEDRLYRQNGKNADLQAALHSTAPRRRAAFWRAADRFSGHWMLHGRPISHTSHLEILGWSPGLRLDDLGWALADLQEQQSDDRRLLALDAALVIWRDNGRLDDVLDRIRAPAQAYAGTRDYLNAMLSPVPVSDEERRQNEEFAAARAKHEADQVGRDRSWAAFVDELRADPSQLRRLSPPTREKVDGRLFDLWQLLNSASGDGNRYAIDTVSALEPMLGTDLTSAFRDALVSFWRQWRPQLVSERAPDKRNTIYTVDCMGITSVSVEAKAAADWPSTLTSAEATRAAQYATLELNGFPSWFAPLAAAWPNEVAGILMGEVRARIALGGEGLVHGVLQDLVYGPMEAAAAIFDGLLGELQGRPDFSSGLLAPVLDILVRAATTDESRRQLGELALERVQPSSDPDLAALYLSTAFACNAGLASEALTAKLDALDQTAQTALSVRLLPRLFGEAPFGPRAASTALPFEVLKRLVLIAFRTIRVDEDTTRPSGVVYSPDARDHAQNARSAGFNRLVSTPGRATFATLNEWAELPNFPIHPRQLREQAMMRAANDSEHAPWSPSEPYELEQRFDLAPTNPRDLQEVAVRRFHDVEHDLLHSDFAQGRTVKSLRNEREVQKWIANELRTRQGRAYSVEREPHVADEKEPDIRLRAKASDASLPIEVKVAESWSFRELEIALNDQLGGRYLRAQDGKHGILLLVHQQARPQGWQATDGSFLTFEQVAAHLNAIAAESAGSAQDAPQAVVVTIDVSSVTA